MFGDKYLERILVMKKKFSDRDVFYSLIFLYHEISETIIELDCLELIILDAGMKLYLL